MKSKKPLLYLISKILPDPDKTGGEIALYRHLIERSDFQVKTLPTSYSIHPMIRELEDGRFRTYIRGFSYYYISISKSFLQSVTRPNAIVTAAHGRECLLALQAAKFWRVPLITFFHDWGEVIGDIHPRLQFLADRTLKKVYNSSSAAFCVSKAMQERLGPHPGAILLPPIPSTTTCAPAKAPAASVPVLFYSGYCGGAYYEMLNKLIAACSTSPVRLQISGPHSDQLPGTFDNVRKLGFLDRGAYALAFGDADILLVLLNFVPENVRHFSTHFPSKLVEYCSKGKLIGIWGPSYSTAVQWAKETGGAYFYEKDDAQGFVEGLLSVFSDVEERNRYIQRAAEIGRDEFSPEQIHAKFKQAVTKALGRTSLDTP